LFTVTPTNDDIADPYVFPLSSAVKPHAVSRCNGSTLDCYISKYNTHDSLPQHAVSLVH